MQQLVGDAVNQRFIVEWDGVNHYYDSSPETFQVILNADGTILYQYATVALNNGCTVGIENQNGSDGLQVAFNSAYLHDGLAILIDHATPWLDVTPSEGIVAPYSEVTLDVLFDATDLAEGTYTGNITVNSNDQDESTLVIPVTLTVGATTLDPVDDLTITISGGYIVLNWSDVYGATQYRMSNCSTPYGEFEYVGTTSFTTWTTPLTGEVQFFQVTATDE